MIGPLPEMPVPAARSPAPFWAGSDDGSAARRQPMMRAREAPVVDEPWTRTIVVLAVLLVFGLVLRSLFGSVASPVRTVVPPPHALVAVTPEHPPPAIAHNAVGDLRPASRTPTTAERREAERQAAEAARIIERSTPEL
jgi:hypothetical protein